QVIEINSWQTKRISKLVVDKLFGTLSNKKIGILGFSYKSNTNDTRESPAIRICNDLLDEGAILQIYDPKVSKEQIEKDLINENLTKGSWHFFNSIEETSLGSDALLILTEWEEFSEINWELIAKKMRSPSWVFDTRLISNVSESRKYGINLWTVGKGEII
ncbi:nucleotide sugar dehydrogenase, partial [Prochlorococcus sp. AH-736-K21]